TNNAIKFTHSGEVVITVESKFVDKSNKSRYELHFAVTDTGIGIPKDRMDRLFKSFSQVDSSTTRQFGGTGLGLVISKRLSEFMGGRMWVGSEAGEGRPFHFTIRVKLYADDSPSSIPPPAALEGRRVLILEDNATN